MLLLSALDHRAATYAVTLAPLNPAEAGSFDRWCDLAAELGPKGVRVNAICPGLIRTDFAQALWDNPEAAKRANEETPLRRLGEADDLKGVAVFLASKASSYITGQALTVCGGTNMWS